MLKHPGFRKLAFTGSTEVGRNVALAAAEKIIPATLELGGKSANIFFSDCKQDMALDGAQLGILFNQGQVCCAGSRIFVQDDFYDEFVGKLIDAFNKVTVGDPTSMDTQMGSQINEGQLKKILSYIELAKKEGATIACGGERYTEGPLAKGAFMRPTLITDVTNDMRVAQEEIFGPVLPVTTFKTLDEAIEMAGDVLPLMLCRMEENEEPIPEASALSHLHLKANKTAVNIETDTMEYRKKLSV